MTEMKIDTIFHTDALNALNENAFCTILKLAYPDEAHLAKIIWDTEFSKYDLQSRIYYLRGRKKFTHFFELWALGWEFAFNAEEKFNTGA